MDLRKCAACATEIGVENDGVEIWNSWYCAKCFIGQAQETNRPLKPGDIEALKVLARELAGLLPGTLLEIVLYGFHKRTTPASTPPPSREEVQRVVGEIQRLVAFSSFKQALNLLKGWNDAVKEFVEGQERDILDKVKKLTDFE